MREVTAEELGTWLGELPEEVRPKVDYDAEVWEGGAWFADGCGSPIDLGHALVLWFTAATLYLWERGYSVRRAGPIAHRLMPKDTFIGNYENMYEPLAAAIRRVRAEEGKQ